MTEPLLEMRSVSTWVESHGRSKPILLDVDFEIGRGEIVGLVGESGSGKSMTARTIVRSLPPGGRTSGEVRLAGEDLVAMPAGSLREIRARKVGVIFQDPRSAVDPLWRIEDHLTEGMRVHERLSRDDARRRAVELLEQVGIRDGIRRLGQYPVQLSGGLLQRVVIAGALAGNPELIIADEPTTALDVTTQAEIIAIFSTLRRDRGIGMLFITHDLALAASLCDRILVMYGGRIVDAQSHDGIFTRPGHPYTRALVGARPSAGVRSDRLSVIPGIPTSASDAPAGCPFRPRCGFASEICAERVPELLPVDGGASACVRIHEIRDALRV
jgi:oligopeptide/dipeptide ABC transporter ATP-binding protein